MKRYIEIAQQENGSHDNQTGGRCAEGWAIIPDDIELPDSYPFVDIEVVDGVVVSMTPRPVPDPAPVPDYDLADVDIEQLRADVDFLLIMGGYEV